VLEVTTSLVFIPGTGPSSKGQDYSLCARMYTNVRTGLVVIGVALAVVGAGLTLSAFFEPGAPSLTKVNPIAAANLQPGLSRTMIVWLQNTSSGSLALSWVSSADVNVSVYRGTTCDFISSNAAVTYCLTGPALASWPSNSSGHWTTSGEISFPLLLNLENLGPKAVTVNAVFDEVWASTSPSVPTWIFLSTLAGGVTCIGLGGIAIFLGLFLRAGVFSGAPRDENPPSGGFDPDDYDVDDEPLDGPSDEPPR
jgi:hypothetical protein